MNYYFIPFSIFCHASSSKQKLQLYFRCWQKRIKPLSQHSDQKVPHPPTHTHTNTQTRQTHQTSQHRLLALRWEKKYVARRIVYYCEKTVRMSSYQTPLKHSVYDSLKYSYPRGLNMLIDIVCSIYGLWEIKTTLYHKEKYVYHMRLIQCSTPGSW